MNIFRIVCISLVSLLLILASGCSIASSYSTPTQSVSSPYPTVSAAETNSPPANPVPSVTVTPSSSQPALIINIPSAITPSILVTESPAVLSPLPAATPSPTLSSTPNVQPTPTVSEAATDKVNSERLTQLQNLANLKVKTSASRSYSETPDNAPTPTCLIYTSEISTVDMTVTWNGTSFSGSWSIDPSYVDPDPKKQNDIRDIKATVTGIVSEDGENLTSLEYLYDGKTYPPKVFKGKVYRVMDSRYYTTQQIKIQLQNIPLDILFNQIGAAQPFQVQTDNPIDLMGFEDRGSQIQNYFVNLEYYEKSIFAGTVNSSGEYSKKYTSTDWTAKGANAPSLSVIFSK